MSWEPEIKQGYVQLEKKAPRGIKVIRVYDPLGTKPRFMSYMWDIPEHMEIPLSITMEDLMEAHRIASDLFVKRETKNV